MRSAAAWTVWWPIFTEFDKRLSAPSFKFTPPDLLNGATKLAYEISENKSKGGESQYAGTSINDIYRTTKASMRSTSSSSSTA